MKASREYQTLACNDRMVIMTATLRRTLMEMIALCNGEGQVSSLPFKSFPALLGYINAVRAAYALHAAKKIKDRLVEHLEGPADPASMPAFMQRLIKAGIDHVGSARVGAALAVELVYSLISELVEQDQAPASATAADQLKLTQVVAGITSLLSAAEGMLDEAARRFLAEARVPVGEQGIEVIAHDLTAPIIVVTPGPTSILVPVAQVAAQAPADLLQFAADHFEELTSRAVEQLLKESAGT